MARLAAMAGACGPGRLHIINGLYEAHRNPGGVTPLVNQIVTAELQFHFIRKIDFKSLSGAGPSSATIGCVRSSDRRRQCLITLKELRK